MVWIDEQKGRIWLGQEVSEVRLRQLAWTNYRRSFMKTCAYWLILCAALGLLQVPAVIAGNSKGTDDAPSKPILLDVDAAEAPRGIYHAQLEIPAEPGPLTLFYPKWIPGNHGPTGPISDLAGLKMQAGGQAVSWRRDDVDMYAFHCQVPPGAHALHVSLDLLAAPSGRGGASSTPAMAVIRWNQMLLYPKGQPARAISFQASLRVPKGWLLGTALPIAAREAGQTRFGPVSLETLVDAPVLTGVYFREVPLGVVDGRPHCLELACDSPDGLDLAPETRTHYQALVAEAGKLFGSRHYRSYRFLITLTDYLGVHGLEHHESSDNGLPERALVDRQIGTVAAFLLPHEYVHSWNGKYRRPVGLDTPDFQQAQQTRLLWVYEGLTEYLGTILTARSGLWTPQETRDYLALTAEVMQNQRGRAWRSLEDTTLVSPMLAFGTGGWGAWRRSADYYDEGVLIWLEVDTRIRQLTQGQRSLDDFCRRFFGGDGGVPEVKPYTFEDIVTGLNAVVPYDWKALLQRRVTATTEQAPLDGIEASGWRLAYGDKPTDLEKAAAGLKKVLDLSSSLGLLLSPEGTVIDVIPGKAADRAGVGPGMKILAVNSRRWTADRLNLAVAASKKPNSTLELLLEKDDLIRTYRLDYHDGPRHARLERVAKRPDLLAEILKPQAAAVSGTKAAKAP
jgi:predicted metalloprotease with PDZ domain